MRAARHIGIFNKLGGSTCSALVGPLHPDARPSGHLVDLEQQLAGLLMEFEVLSAAWPKAEHVLDRARISRRRAETLLAIRDLRMRIANVRAETLEDCAVQLRRLDAMAGDDDPEMALLVVSVLAVVERVA